MKTKTAVIAAFLLLVAFCTSGCDGQQSSEAFHRGRDLVIKGQFDAAESELAFIELLDGNTRQAEQQFEDIVKQSRSIYLAEATAVRAMLDRKRAE